MVLCSWEPNRPHPQNALDHKHQRPALGDDEPMKGMLQSGLLDFEELLGTSRLHSQKSKFSCPDYTEKNSPA